MGYSKKIFICPYYVRDYRDRMSCEAGSIRLKDRRSMRIYMSRYCATFDWEQCSLAKALDAYYERRYRNGEQAEPDEEEDESEEAEGQEAPGALA